MRVLAESIPQQLPKPLRKSFNPLVKLFTKSSAK